MNSSITDQIVERYRSRLVEHELVREVHEVAPYERSEP